MPNLDRKATFERIELFGTMTLEKSVASGQIIAGCSMYTQWCVDAVSVLTGIEIGLQGVEGSGSMTVGTYATVRIPLLGVNLSITLDATLIHTGAVPYVVEIYPGVLYSMAGGAWRLKFSALRVYINGSLVHSEGATTLDNYYYFTPAGIPLLGIPPAYAASAAVNPAPIIGGVDRSTTISSTTSYGRARITDAGCRFKEPGSSEWQALPVLVDLLAIPSVECDCAAPDPADLVASSMSDVAVSAEQHLERETTLHLTGQPLYCTNGPATSGSVDIYKTRLEWWGNSSAVTTVPNLPASVKRIHPSGHREVVYRGGMPQTIRSATKSCGVDGIGEGIEMVTVTDEVHPRQSDILSVVGAGPDALEDTFGYAVPSPAARNEFRYKAIGYSAVITGPAACPAVLPEEPPGTVIPPTAPEDEVCYITQSSTFVPIVDDEFDNPDLLGYLHHADALVRYMNYWGSRHWSFFNWFPGNTIDTDDDGIPDAQDVWKVFDDRIDVGYWLAKGDQYTEHPALPPSERLRTRTTLFTAPLTYGQLRGFVGGAIGVRSSWWGDETFRVDAAAPLVSLEVDADASASWIFEDCSASFGAGGITLTPDPGKTTITAKLALGSFTQWPYLYPHLASEIEVDWEPGNIDTVAVEMVGHSGSTATLTDTPGRYPRPMMGADSIYSGSYAQDLGQFFFEDKGDDLLPEGDSDAAMADAERTHAFALLAGRTAAELRFTIDVLSDAATCEIKYPVLYASIDNAGLFPENRSNHVVVWPDGPGIRFGNVAHYYDGIVNATPIAVPPGVPPLPGLKLAWMPSAIDWLCFKNLALNALPHDDDLATHIADLFDSEEASDAGEADHAAIAMLVPRGTVFPVAAIVNGSGCPPVCMWPTRMRDVDTLAKTGDWGLETWSYAEERRFYVGNEAMSLNGPDVFTSLYSPAISGWPVTFHRSAVTNEEDYHQVRHGAAEVGTIRPWQGCLIVRRPASGEIGREPDVLHTSDGLRWEALVIYDEGLARDSLVVRRSHGMPVYGFETQVEVANGEEASFPSLAFLAWGRLVCAYTRAGAFQARYSDDDGETWEDEVALISPADVAGRIHSNPDGETLAIAFRYNSGSSGPGKLYYRFQGPGDTAMSAAAAIVSSSGSAIDFEPESFGLSWDPSLGAWSLMAKKSGDPGPTRFYSADDGASWTEVS